MSLSRCTMIPFTRLEQNVTEVGTVDETVDMEGPHIRSVVLSFYIVCVIECFHNACCPEWSLSTILRR